MTSYQPHTPVLMFNLSKKPLAVPLPLNLGSFIPAADLQSNFQRSPKIYLWSMTPEFQGEEPKEQWFLFLRRSWGFWASQALLEPQEAWHHSSPVQPSQQGLGSANELHYRSQELVGGLAGRVPIVGWTLPPATYVILQIVGRCSQFQNQVLHIIGFKAIILWEIKSKEKA